MARGQLGGYLDSAVEEMAHVLGQAGSPGASACARVSAAE
jgi:hypothetical protein